MSRLPPALAALALLAACDSPEASRTMGGGPGADTGNRPAEVRMHEGSDPFEKTPRLIAVEPPSLDGAHHARSRSTK